jgi:hypothetical protein
MLHRRTMGEDASHSSQPTLFNNHLAVFLKIFIRIFNLILLLKNEVHIFLILHDLFHQGHFT